MQKARVLVMLVGLVGCVAGGEPARKHRWPDHRTNHDQQLDDLQKRVTTLEKQLEDMRAYVAKLQVQAAAPATPVPAAPAAP